MRYALRCSTVASFPRSAANSCISCSSSPPVDCTNWSCTMRSPPGNGSCESSMREIVSNAVVPTAMATAIANPATIVRPGCLSSMRRLNRASSHSASSQREPCAPCAVSSSLSPRPALINARRRAGKRSATAPARTSCSALSNAHSKAAAPALLARSIRRRNVASISAPYSTRNRRG